MLILLTMLMIVFGGASCLTEASEDVFFIEAFQCDEAVEADGKEIQSLSLEAYCALTPYAKESIDEHISSSAFVSIQSQSEPISTPFPEANVDRENYQLTVQSGDMKYQLSYGIDVGRESDGMLHQFVSQEFLKQIGYYQYDAFSGSYGSQGEMSDKVRIMLINGIMNAKDDLCINLQQLAKTHGGVNVHFVFRPTKGWTADILECCKVKTGYVSSQARLLAAKWKLLIQEMGGVNGGGEIIHYAHSIGGAETYTARQLLTPQEQKMIHVITMGSPIMIPNEGFASVVNYVSKRDGISLADPIGYLSGWFYPNTNIVFVGTFLGIPFIDHSLTNDSYEKVMSVLGEQFLKKYQGL